MSHRQKRWGVTIARTLLAMPWPFLFSFSLSSLSLFSVPAHAAFDDLGAGARAPGMSNAFVPIADDVYTIHYNPAGLGILERPQLGTSYSSLYPGLKDGSALASSFIGYAHPLKEGRAGTLGTAWSSFALNGSLYREDTLSLSYGRLATHALGGELHLGFTAKYLLTTLGQVAEASNAVPDNTFAGGGQTDPALGRKSRGVPSADLGLLHRFSKSYAVGLALSDVNQPDVSLSGSGLSRVPMGAKLGFGYRSLISNVAVQADSKKGATGKQDLTFTAAAERWFPKLFTGDFGLRGGLSLGSRDFKQATLGLSYRTRRFGADYAMALPIGSVATTIGSHRVALNFRFGRVTEDEESLEMVLEAMKALKTGQTARLGRRATDSTRMTLSEFLAQARVLEARARYADALQKMRSALMIAPADGDVLAHQQRLAFVAPMIGSLPEYKTDPAQASLHLGILAYLAGNDLEAIRKVSDAHAQKPDHRSLDAFLMQLETATGIKRTTFATAKRSDYKAAVNLTRANSAIEEGDYEKAVELSLAVVREEPESAAAWQNLGTAFFALKDYDSSLKSWQRAYELEKSPSIRMAIKATIKSITRAKEQRRGVIAAKPIPLPSERMSVQRSQELFNQAIDHYTRREFREARALLERIVEADPENIEAQKALKRVKDELK